MQFRPIHRLDQLKKSSRGERKLRVSSTDVTDKRRYPNSKNPCLSVKSVVHFFNCELRSQPRYLIDLGAFVAEKSSLAATIFIVCSTEKEARQKRISFSAISVASCSISFVPAFFGYPCHLQIVNRELPTTAELKSWTISPRV